MNPAATPLEISDVSVLYGANRVLDRVSLSAAGGEFIALLGASGCGKTTLLRAICGFVPVAAGSIAVDGHDITRLPPDKRNIAMVFQSYALWPHMTVAQNIGYGLRLRRVSRSEIARQIAESLTMLRLEGLGERKVTALSGCSAVRDHNLPKMPAAFEMAVGLLRLGERECPIDHGVQPVHRNRAVHRLEIGAASDADRAEGNTATGEQ
jgi:ABC-type lipopolysaccharide export system ATPase subunit